MIIPQYLESAFSSDETFHTNGYGDFRLQVVDIGNIHVADGKIIACDPFVFHNNPPFTTQFPTGDFPVDLAIANTATDSRIAFARIRFTDKLPVTWQMAVADGQNIADLGPDDIFGYGVDSGTGCFMDTSGAKEYENFLDEEIDNWEVVQDEMEKDYEDTRSWLLWSRNNGNVAMFSSGFGDGFYATYVGYDVEGKICRLTTDFSVLEVE